VRLSDVNPICIVLLQEMTAEYNEKKQMYDTASAGLESNMAKLEGEVKHAQ